MTHKSAICIISNAARAQVLLIKREDFHLSPQHPQPRAGIAMKFRRPISQGASHMASATHLFGDLTGNVQP